MTKNISIRLKCRDIKIFHENEQVQHTDSASEAKPKTENIVLAGKNIFICK